MSKKVSKPYEKAITVKASLCIFQVRNTIFHKGKRTSLIGGCNNFLRDLINELVKNLLEKA